MVELLENELTTYEKNKETLKEKANNKYVLIKGDEVIGIYENQIDALSEGYRRFGNEPFLVKQILEVDAPQSLISGFVII